MVPDTDLQRVFFALWPDDPLRERLATIARGGWADGRPVPDGHLHLTLAFAGTVAAAVVAELQRRADRLDAPPVRLTLDQLGYFPRPRVTWIGPSIIPDGLGTLADAVAGICRSAGVDLESRPFRPHLTLRRFVTRFEPVAVEPLDWFADAFLLVESGRGGNPGEYRVLRRWSLHEEA